VSDDKVVTAENALYRYFDVLRGGATMTVYTKNHGGARTNVVAVIRKEPGVWGDWEVVSRPATANPDFLPETWHEAHAGIISTATLAETFAADSDLWGSVSE